MNPDDIVEVFVSTIIAAVILVILVTLLNQDIGMVLVDLLPNFLELLIWLFVVGIILYMLFELIDNM